MEGHAKKCVERCCELENKTTQQLYKVSTPCIDDHHFQDEDLKSVAELSQVSSEIVLKCCYLGRIVRLHILWSVIKLARSITKWTKACDKRLNRLISYIHHTCDYKQYCHVGNTTKQWRLGPFQDSDFVNITPHTSHFLAHLHADAWLKSRVCRARIICHDSSSCAHVFVLTLFDFSTILSAHQVLSYDPVFFSFPSTSSSRM